MSQSSVPAVGIDLGTTFSVIACLDSSGRPQTVPNAEGDLLTPSAVFFDRDNTVVGKEALKAGAIEPERLAQFVKRDMGNPVYSKPVNGEHLPPEVIQSLVLEKLKSDAGRRLGPIATAVITVPAYFNEPRRKATQDAGRIAGLDVIDIVNEPTAAAIAYGLERGFLTREGRSPAGETILVYDLGGGTFDATLMRIEGAQFMALATAGDVRLGGLDWDRRLADLIAEDFTAHHSGLDPRKDPAGNLKLLREAEEAKRALSVRGHVTVAFEYAGEALRVPIARRAFEERSSDLLERTRFTVASLLQEAGQSWSDIARIILVGGATRMPMVRAMLDRESGNKVETPISEDEAVAHGAALFAGLLLRSAAPLAAGLAVQNVNSHDLGVLGIEEATGRPRRQVIIPRNSPLPARNVQRFRTLHANQHSVVVNVVEGGDASGHDATPIGRCVIRDLPAGLSKGTAVEVAFEYATNGRLSVDAVIPSVGKNARLDIERNAGLSSAQLDEWHARLNRNGITFKSLD